MSQGKIAQSGELDMTGSVPVLQDVEAIPVIEMQYVEAAVLDRAALDLTLGFVPIRMLHKPDILRLIVATECRERHVSVDKIDPDKLQTPLCGGCVLRTEGRVMVEPQCCGDLGDFANWMDAVAYRSADWKQLWIGHPLISVRYADNVLVFSELHEPDDGTALSSGEFAISPEVLERAMKQAVAELRLWASSMSLVLQRMTSLDDANQIARCLAGLRSHEES
jgi:hypothetical protein